VRFLGEVRDLVRAASSAATSGSTAPFVKNHSSAPKCTAPLCGTPRR
jgi:hypothetical protein